MYVPQRARNGAEAAACEPRHEQPAVTPFEMCEGRRTLSLRTMDTRHVTAPCSWSVIIIIGMPRESAERRRPERRLVAVRAEGSVAREHAVDARGEASAVVVGRRCGVGARHALLLAIILAVIVAVVVAGLSVAGIRAVALATTATTTCGGARVHRA